MSRSDSRNSGSGRTKRNSKAADKHPASASSKSAGAGDARVQNASVVSGGKRQQGNNGRGQLKLSALPQASDFAGSARTSSDSGWKSALHRYVSLYNQAETEQHARVLTDFVTDEVHAERLMQRLDRIRERDLYRGALPAGSETKADIIRVNESTHEVSVLVKLHIKRRMEQSGLYYMEERSEYERIWLTSEGRDWNVLQVEPIIAERRPRYGASVHQWLAEAEGESESSVYLAPSTPFLNYEVMPNFQNRTGTTRYRRDLAAAYADRWWNEGNSAYELFDVNCTNYVSQCIFAGNAPMNYTGKRGSGWWYKGRSKGQEWWSYSWAVSHALNQYLSAARKSGLKAVTVQSADELQLGDVITYDWNGDGRFEHSTIVTAFDSSGQPLVNANTVASRHRYWDYRDSYAWTRNTRYRFFHIPDVL
ncbi:amidase domain-containing protein [Paenibacillus sp. GCM10027627]|uniref:amidase domain-containing protein n=1 Tax=unclassified Paenibacillus TaxID=185978 RepID=UPI00362D6983